MLECVEEKKHN